MTAQEIDRIQNAIRHIQTAVDVDPWAVQIAVNAMEKQIPKKPGEQELIDKYVLGKQVYAIPCGNCGEYINTLWNFCPWCGQSIMGSNYDDE